MDFKGQKEKAVGDIERAVGRGTAKDIERAVGRETAVAYMMAMSMDILMNDVERRIERGGIGKMKFDTKRAFDEYVKAVKLARHWYDRIGDSAMWNAVEGDAAKYDSVRDDANDLVRIAMLCVDRKGAIDALEGLESRGIFSKEEIARFVRKRG